MAEEKEKETLQVKCPSCRTYFADEGSVCGVCTAKEKAEEVPEEEREKE